MPNSILQTLGWWIAVIELPVVSALFRMMWTSRRDLEEAVQILRDDLADHKVDVARTYAQTKDLRLLENRLTAHLLRIEAKLDATALKAEQNSFTRG